MLSPLKSYLLKKNFSEGSSKEFEYPNGWPEARRGRCYVAPKEKKR
jgi:hypothetical protein